MRSSQLWCAETTSFLFIKALAERNTALTSSFRKGKTFFSVFTKPFYSSEYTASLCQSQIIWKTVSAQASKWIRRNNTPFFLPTLPLICWQPKVIVAVGQLKNWQGAGRVYLEDSEKSRTRIAICSVSTNRKVWYCYEGFTLSCMKMFSSGLETGSCSAASLGAWASSVMQVTLWALIFLSLTLVLILALWRKHHACTSSLSFSELYHAGILDMENSFL